MERKLASIQRILALDPIEGADRIEVATVQGWKVAVQKGLHKVNDLVAYFEIDSWVPTTVAPFLTKEGQEPREYEGVRGERLRTVKLRGQISQGVILPLDDFTNLPLPPYDFLMGKWNQEGLDITEQLGVIKYEPPIPACLAGQVKGMFPGFIRKTDQERIQNLPEFFEEHKDLGFEVTVKLDGSSMTVYHRDMDTGVCSRNLDLKEDESNSFWRIAHRLHLIDILKHLGINMAIQGELIGEGIQGNHDKLKGQELFVFDIWDIEAHRYMTRLERQDVLQAIETLLPEGEHLRSVPVVHEDLKVFQAYPTMEDVLSFAGAGPSLNAPIREGLVFKSTSLVNGETVSFKAINSAYLLLTGN
jgi:RNA ligase (TIGR02306 family)